MKNRPSLAKTVKPGKRIQSRIEEEDLASEIDFYREYKDRVIDKEDVMPSPPIFKRR